MKNKLTNYDTVTVCVAVVYILFTLLIQAISWLLQQNNNSLLKLSATNPSLVTKLNNSSNQKLTMTQNLRDLRTKSLNPVVSTEIEKESIVTTGRQAEVTTPKKRRPTSKVGTTSRPSKTSKSGPSTQSASRQTNKRSSPTIQTAGLGFSI